MGLFDDLDNTLDTGEVVVQSRLPCDVCGSSDALTQYSNHTYCFSCEAHRWNDTKGLDLNMVEFSKGLYGTIQDRGISKETCKFYDVSCQLEVDTNTNKTTIVKHIYPYYKEDKKAGQKIREVSTKSFHTEGLIDRSSELFGQHLFKSANKKYLIITEGELDALSAFQMVDGLYACVSLPLGSGSAHSAVKANLEFINNFEYCILAFDNDEQGREAVKKSVTLFESGKCKIMQFPTGFKDANDMLKAGKDREFIQLIYNSEQYKPEGIVDLYDVKTRFLESRKSMILSNRLYPWACLNKDTYGIRTSELVIVTAETGIGKTSLVREIQNHLLRTTDDKIGVMYIEETIEDTFGRTMGLEMKEPIYLPKTELNEDALQATMDKIGKGRLFAYEHFGSTGLDEIIARIRYMNKALGVKIIILDHISMLIDERYDDERRALDNIVDRLRLLSIELDVCIFAISHLNREGKLWGTSKIEKLANLIIKLERDNMSEYEADRCRSKVILLKNRFGGRTGTVGFLDYNPITNKLEETNDQEEERTKEDHFKQEGKRAFTAGSL